MSTKAIVLKRNPKDNPKRLQLLALGPTPFIEYSAAGSLSHLRRDFGSLDYLLMTGGHGDFLNSKPTKFNDTTILDIKDWIAKSSGQFKAIILDTCFSSGVLSAFLPLVPYGGSVVCAHGSGEGWADGFSVANGTKKIGEVLSTVIDNMAGFGTYASVGIAVRKPTNQLLYTMNGGTHRKAGLTARNNMGMDSDSEEELKQLDNYLFGNQISVVAVKDAAELKLMLTNNLKMTVV